MEMEMCFKLYKKTLEVKDINLPDQEVEIIISIHNLIKTGDKFLLQ